MREVKTGQIYRHFKGELYQIVSVARHSETKEKYVVYQQLYGQMEVWVRPYDMFVSEVDHKKYPDVSQKYRFELLNTLAGDWYEVKNYDISPQNEDSMEKEMSIESEAINKEAEPTITVDKESAGDYLPDERLIHFLELDSINEKINYLNLIKNEIDDKLINDISTAMDLVIDEGPIDARFQSLKNCLYLKSRFECQRRYV